jgi:hypothetical protein
VQRRAVGKENWPNKLDLTVGGHLEAGESALDGLWEVEEELGLVVAPEESCSRRTGPAWNPRVESRIPAGLDREFQELFLLIGALSLKDLCLQKEEVDAVLRLRLDDVKELYKGLETTAEEWGERKSSAPVRLVDYNSDEVSNLLRAARAAHVALTGERPDSLF